MSAIDVNTAIAAIKTKYPAKRIISVIAMSFAGLPEPESNDINYFGMLQGRTDTTGTDFKIKNFGTETNLLLGLTGSPSQGQWLCMFQVVYPAYAYFFIGYQIKTV